MHNKSTQYLCHMNAQEKKIYNRNYYQQNKDYWVRWRKEHQEPSPLDWDSPPETRKAWQDAQKSNRPDYALLAEQRKKIGSGALSSVSSARARLDAQKSARSKGVEQWSREGAERFDDAQRIASKAAAKKTPYSKVSIEDLEKERAMLPLAKVARDVKRRLRSASDTFKTSWQIGASDLIKLGKQIKEAWDKY